MKTNLIVTLLFLCGCASTPKQESVPHSYLIPQQIEPIPANYLTQEGKLNTNLIAALTAEVAKRHGMDVADFKAPGINKKNKEWYIHYEAKVPCLGCYFSISVNENSLTTFYSQGR